ncbi:ATP synthase F0 subunit C [bacterium]|nr:MAG: ATP synthase F0 subunit C [bacterium]
MHSLTEVTLTEFQSALTPQNIRVIQIIQGAIGLGVVMFMGVVLFVYSSQTMNVDARITNDDYDLINILTLAHIMIAAAVYTVARVVFNLLLSSSVLRNGVTKIMKDGQGRVIENPAEKMLAIIRSAMIVRLAMIEAPAIFGLVICLIATFNGTIQETPSIWLNAITALILIGFVILTFPNKERVEEIFNSKISGTPS